MIPYHWPPGLTNEVISSSWPRKPENPEFEPDDPDPRVSLDHPKHPEVPSKHAIIH